MVRVCPDLIKVLLRDRIKLDTLKIEWTHVDLQIGKKIGPQPLQTATIKPW